MNVLRFSIAVIAVMTLSLSFAHAQETQPYFTQQPELPPAPPANPAAAAQPIMQRPIQTPPKRVYQNGTMVNGQQPATQPAADNRTLPPGYGSPFPTNLPLPREQPGSVPANSFKVAQANPNPQSVPLYAPTAPAAPPQNLAAPPANRQPVHIGSAAPESRFVPFFLNPQEQQELDEFLARWEKYSAGINRYDVDFNMFLYDSGISGDTDKPYKTAFGYFKFIAQPMRYVYSVEGEWVGKDKVKRSDDPKTANILADKIIIDDKSVYKYDYNAKNVLQINVPAEIIGRGIADSPLPLIFGAKAVEMKRRFSMKIRTVEQNGTPCIFLQAKPLLLEDQTEFTLIELILEKNTLRARGLKRHDINGKAFTVYELQSPVINGNLATILADIKTHFTPSVPRGWKYEVKDWAIEVQMAQRSEPGVMPAGTAPTNTLPIAEQRSEIPLYSPQR